MLRFRRDRVFLGITQDGLSYVRFSGAFSNTLIDHGTHPLQGKDARPEIPDAVGALIAAANLRGTEVYITLADRLVRHFVCERPAGTRSAREITLAARLRFEEVFSTSATDWEVQVDLRPLATRLLACAIPKPLLNGLILHCANADLKLRSIRPLSLSEIDRSMPTFGQEHAVFAVASLHSLWFARSHGRNWQSAQTHSISGNISATLTKLLQQERLRMPEGGTPPVVRISGCIADAALRRQLEEQAVHLSGAAEWPGQDREWTSRYRIALSPVWPPCA